jgi:hypothetical protein
MVQLQHEPRWEKRSLFLRQGSRMISSSTAVQFNLMRDPACQSARPTVPVINGVDIQVLRN